MKGDHRVKVRSVKMLPMGKLVAETKSDLPLVPHVGTDPEVIASMEPYCHAPN